MPKDNFETKSVGSEVVFGWDQPGWDIEAAYGASGAVASGGSNTYIGTKGDDTFDGSNANTWLYLDGKAGNDTLIGGKFADDIFGGKGDDTLIGNGGDDWIFGGQGDDDIFGGAGWDKLRGDAGDDEIFGGKGNDNIGGGDGNDELFGEGGKDYIFGGAGADLIDGGAGADDLWGDGGNDKLFGRGGNDIVSGNFGNDEVDGGAGNDFLFGDGGKDKINGGTGDDDIFGGAGIDTAIFDGSVLDFFWEEKGKFGDKIQITDLNAGDGDEGTDLLRGIEFLQFDDGVTVAVDGSNNAPFLVADPQVADEDNPLAFSIQAYDFDGDALAFVGASIVSPGGGTLTLDSTSALNPAVGTGLGLNLIFDPNGDFEDLDDGESATVTAEVQVQDANGVPSTISFDITVNGVDDGPEADDGTASTNEDAAPLDIDLNSFVSDPGAGSLTFDVISAETQGGVPVNVTLNGSVVTIDPDQFTDLAVGENETVLINYSATDANNDSDDGTVTLTVEGRNDTPVISVETGDSDAAAIAETDAGLTASGTLTLTDVDTTDLVGVAVTGVTVAGTTSGAPDNATLLAMLSVSPAAVLDGTESTDGFGWSFDSGTEAFNYLAVNESLSLAYEITATDDNGATTTQTVTVTVNGSNDDPVAGDLTDEIDEPDTAITIDLNTLVSDPDTSDILTFMVDSDGPSLDPVTGIVTIDPEQFASLGVGDSTVFQFDYRVDDPFGGMDIGTVTLTINGLNDAPVALDDTVTVTEDDGESIFDGELLIADGVVSIDLTALVSDVDSGDSVTVSFDGTTGDAVAGSFDPVTGIFTFEADQYSSLSLGDSVSFTINYTADDGNMLSNSTSSGAVTVIVAGQNDSPFLTDNGDPDDDLALIDDLNLAPLNEATGDTVDVDLTQLFGDPDDNDTLTYGLVSIVDPTDERKQISAQLNNGILTLAAEAFGLAAGETRDFIVTVRATDSSGAENNTVTGQFVVTVNGSGDDGVPPNTNTAPLAGSATLDFFDDRPIVIDLKELFPAEDADGQMPFVEEVNFLSGGRGQIPFTLVDGVVTIDPSILELADGVEEELTFTYTVNDGSGAPNATATGTVTLNITGGETPNTPPVAGDDVIEDAFVEGPVNQGGTPGVIDLNPLISDPDPGDTLVITQILIGGEGLAVPIEFDETNGVVTFDPADLGVADGVTETFELTYTVSDGTDTATGTVTFDVQGAPGINARPDAADSTLDVDEADGVAVIELEPFISDNDGDSPTVVAAVILIDGVVQTGIPVTINPISNVVSFDPEQFGLDNLETEQAVLRYTIDDGAGASNSTATGDIALNVIGTGGSGNTRPVANDGSAAYDLDVDTGPLVIDLATLASDADPNTTLAYAVDSLTYIAEGDPVSVDFTQTGSVIEVSRATLDLLGVTDGESLALQLQYTVDDGSNAGNSSDSGTVLIDIANPADTADDEPLDFEFFTPLGLDSRIVTETDAIDRFAFAGDTSLVNTSFIDDSRPGAPQGLVEGQTTPGGSSVLLGSRGIESRVIGGVSQDVEVDFAIHATDSSLRVGSDATNTSGFISDTIDPFDPALGFVVDGGFSLDPNNLTNFSLNVVGNAGAGNNAAVDGDVTFYKLGATVLSSSGSFVQYEYQLYAVDTFEFTADPDTPASATTFTQGTVSTDLTGVTLSDDYYAVTFATDDGSSIVLDDFAFF